MVILSTDPDLREVVGPGVSGLGFLTPTVNLSLGECQRGQPFLSRERESTYLWVRTLPFSFSSDSVVHSLFSLPSPKTSFQRRGLFINGRPTDVTQCRKQVQCLGLSSLTGSGNRFSVGECKKQVQKDDEGFGGGRYGKRRIPFL